MQPKYTAYPTRQDTDLQRRLRDQEVRELRQETLQEMKLTTRRTT